MPNRIDRSPEEMNGIRAIVGEIGFAVVSEYKNARTKLHLQCKRGHDRFALYKEIEEGKVKECIKCLKQEEVKQGFAAAGLTTLEDYQGEDIPVRFRCSNNHLHKMLWRAVKQGQGCAFCSGKKVTAEIVQSFLTEIGHTLLSEYKKNSDLLTVRCNKNHTYRRTWTQILDYSDCPFCEGYRVSDEVIQEFLDPHRLTLSGHYIKAGQAFEITCNAAEHVFTTTWDYIQERPRCPYCDGTKITTEFIQRQLGLSELTLESEYTRSTDKMKIRCSANHTFYRSWTCFQQCPLCPYCSGTRMTEEDKIIAKIKDRLAGQFRDQFMRLLKAGEKIPVSSKSAIVNELIPEIYELLGSPPPVDPKDPDKWVIDHVVPIRFFDLRNLDEVKACWRGHNLRWLKRSPNSSRQHRLTMQEVCLFTPEQLDILRIASRKPQKWKDYLSNLKQKQNNPHQLTLDLLRVAGLSIAS